MTNPHLVTTIVITYNRPDLLKETVSALLRQTHDNLEIILINNGGTGETTEYLKQVAAADARVRLMHYQENQWSLDDPAKWIRVCLNAGLQAATGDYVWFNADDDYVADDYIEKMVALFEGDPECTTAAGIQVAIDIESNIIDPGPRTTNFRPRYMPGHELALQILDGNNKVFSSPGYAFTIKRDVLVQAGGYHPAFEDGERFGIVPFGVTGFDDTAIFYWRSHAGQGNRPLSARGWIGIDDRFALIKEWQLEQRWSVFGKDIARTAIRSIERQITDHAATWFVIHLYSLKPIPAFRLLRKMWFRPYYWYRALVRASQKTYYINIIAPLLKPPLKQAFRLWPGLANLTPSLSRLSEKIGRWT